MSKASKNPLFRRLSPLLLLGLACSFQASAHGYDDDWRPRHHHRHYGGHGWPRPYYPPPYYAPRYLPPLPPPPVVLVPPVRLPPPVVVAPPPPPPYGYWR